jgi:hypothetical protein
MTRLVEAKEEDMKGSLIILRGLSFRMKNIFKQYDAI